MSFLGHLVKTGRLDLLLAVAPKVTVAKIVGWNEDDIWASSRFRSRRDLSQRRDRNETSEKNWRIHNDYP